MSVRPVIFTVKSQPMRLELLFPFPKKLITKAVAAWPSCFIGWWDPGTDEHSIDLHDPDRSRRLWEWEGAHFDTRKLFLEVGPSFAEIISKLAAAFVIYPDGSYNQDFFYQYSIYKGEGNGPGRHGNG